MLIRTVYGPELAAIYSYLVQTNGRLSRHDIHQAFMPVCDDGPTGSTQNIDDALSFLVASGLVQEDTGFHAVSDDSRLPFRLLALAQLKSLSNGKITAQHEVDALYMLILDELFIKSDRVFVADVHAEANKLRRIKAAGGLSREKIQAWKRVMSFLGVGQRVETGFQCTYAPDLLLSILASWRNKDGLLQSFFESHLTRYLPFETEAGDLAQAIVQPLLYLAGQGRVALAPRQDSPSKPYFGKRQFRHIAGPEERVPHDRD